MRMIGKIETTRWSAKCPQHHWELFLHSKDEIGEQCCYCAARRYRKPSKAESKRIDLNWKRSMRELNSLHALVHEFGDAIKDLSGWEAMQAADAFYKKTGKERGMKTACVDDGHFAGSRIYLVPSKNENGWMGVNAYYIPQCTGEKPIQFFLYPDHLNSLLLALTELNFESARHLGCHESPRWPITDADAVRWEREEAERKKWKRRIARKRAIKVPAKTSKTKKRAIKVPTGIIHGDSPLAG